MLTAPLLAAGAAGAVVYVGANSLLPQNAAHVKRKDDGIAFSKDTLNKVATRPQYQDPLSAKECPDCSKRLLLFTRRYCEMDGQLYCRGCTKDVIDLSEMGFDRESHVCVNCFIKKTAYLTLTAETLDK